MSNEDECEEGAARKPGAGLQAVSIALNISLVVITGLVVGAVALYTGNALLDEAREMGDKHMERALAASSADIRSISGVYLASALAEVVTEVRYFLNTPDLVMRQLHSFIQDHDPEVVGDPHWIDTVLRPVIYSKLAPMFPYGTTQILFTALGHSTTHPTAAGRGGTIVVFKADFSFGRLPSNGSHVIMVGETRSNITGSFGPGGFHVGKAGRHGVMVDRDGPCNLFPDWDHEGFGVCQIAPSSLSNEVRDAISMRVLKNSFTPGATLDEADVVHFSPVYADFSFLQISAYMSVTHPAMLNLTPWQEGRMAMLQMSMYTSEVSKLLAIQAVPQDSWLYVVADNHWTGETGVLVGVNSANISHTIQLVSKPFMNGTRLFAKLFHIEEHTMDTATDELSPIARHGAHILNTTDGYKHFARTKENFLEWYDEDSNTLYWFVVKNVTKGSLLWHVSLLVPRSVVMGMTDQSQVLIKKESDDSRRDSTEHQRSIYATIAMLTVACTGLLLTISFFITRKVTIPIELLSRDMSSVASMDLESLEEVVVSSIREVAIMQSCFRVMVKNLTEYRNYMPDSLLMNEDATPAAQSMLSSHASVQDLRSAVGSHFNTSQSISSIKPGLYSSTRNSGAVGRNSAASSLGGVGRPVDSPVNEVLMKRRIISLLYLNIRNFHTIVKEMVDEELRKFSNDTMSLLSSIQKRNMGIVESFAGDRLCCAYNAFSKCGSHKQNAVGTAHEACHEFRRTFSSYEDFSETTILSYAITSGEAVIGHLGCKGMKRVSVVSPILPFVIALERFSKSRGFEGLIDQSVAKAIQRGFFVKQRGYVLYPKVSLKPMNVFESVRRSDLTQEDWMYEKATASPFDPWNAMWECFLEEKWAAAEKLWRAVKPIEGSEILRDILDARQVDPVLL